MEPKDLYGALKPLLLCSKICGLYPGKLAHGGEQKTVFSLLWSVILVLFYTVYAVYSTISLDDGVFVNLVTELGDKTQLYVGVVFAFFAAFNCIYNQNRLMEVLDRLVDFDLDLLKFEPNLRLFNDRRIRIWCLIEIFVLCFTVAIYLYVDVALYLDKISFEKVGKEVVAFCLPIMVASIVVMQFGTILYSVKLRFRNINHKLIKIKEEWNKCVESHGSNKQNNHSIIHNLHKNRSLSTVVSEGLFSEKASNAVDNLRLKHGDLCEICEKVNSIFTFPILLLTIQVFITVILSMFFYFIYTSPAKKSHPVLYAIYSFVITVVNISQLLGLVAMGTGAKKEAKFANEILHSFRNLSEQLDDHLMSFSLQILHNDVSFSGCRIFPVDETLLFSVIGAITTYLMIIIQFQSGFQ